MFMKLAGQCHVVEYTLTKSFCYSLLRCWDWICHHDSFSQVQIININEVRCKREKISIIHNLPLNLRPLLPCGNVTESFVPPFGCEIKAIHHSWACRPCDSPCGEAGLIIEILSAFYANTSPPCVYCKRQETSCGDYGPLLSALWNIAWTSVCSDPSSEHVCFYSSSMPWGWHIYFIIYRNTCYLRLFYTACDCMQSVSPFLRVSYRSPSVMMSPAEHLLMSKKNYFLVWIVAPLTWWKTPLLWQLDATSVLYVNQSGYWSCCQVQKTLLRQTRYIFVQITFPKKFRCGCSKMKIWSSLESCSLSLFLPVLGFCFIDS